MKKSRHRESEILQESKEAETGVPVAELALTYNISNATFYNWRSK